MDFQPTAVPYEWGAAGPDSFDASGLVCFCYGYRSHVWTTNTFISQQAGWKEINVSEAMPGDVVSSNNHCGIYIGGGQMIHAPGFGDVVKKGSIQGDMSYYRYSYETE
ncbi:MAG: C40 family peptidase [Spirochaetia bacterium]|nr:C40 family peptidase [Spirochaetia bacterium]